jgi:hypothetical protein
MIHLSFFETKNVKGGNMQTVNITKPDGTSRELTLVDMDQAGLKELARHLNHLRGAATRAFLAQRPDKVLPAEVRGTNNIIVGPIFGTWVTSFACGEDVRVKKATGLGADFLPRFFAAMKEDCQFLGDNADDISALNFVSQAFGY